MATNIYIDGFNLYYGALLGTQYKWLNLGEMCQQLLPKHQINKIRYFTARVVSLPHDQQAPDRQDVYLRALRTIPNLAIHYGRFSFRPRNAPRYPFVYHSPSAPPETVRIMKTEEKRSDVNLATLLLVDCFDGDFDEAVVISNDSDLTLPIDIVGSKFKKRVGVINPHRNNRNSHELTSVAGWSFRRINRNVLAKCQFPVTLSDSKGTFRKPSKW